MAATVIINEWNAEGTIADKTTGTVRFKNANNSTVDLINPMVVPAAGTVDHSFEKWLRLQITDAGGFTQIDNIQAYSDGENNFGTGSPNEVLVYYATQGGGVLGGFDVPTEPSASFDPPRISEAGSPVEDMTDFFTSSSAARINMDAVNTGPFTDGSPTEHIGDFLVLVMTVRPGATSGVLTAETLTFSFDEI